MKPRANSLIGADLVLASPGYLMASSISETGAYYVTPSELPAKCASRHESAPEKYRDPPGNKAANARA